MKPEALDLVTLLTTLHPDEPRWWKGLAHFHLGENNYGPALTAMTIHGFLSPPTVQEKRLTADLCLAAGIPSRAAELLAEIHREEPAPELVVKLVQALEQAGRMEKALSWAETGSQAYPSNREIQMARGEILFSLRRYPDAAQLFSSLAENDTTGRAWLMLGYCAWNSGEIPKARAAMEKAASLKTFKKQAEKALEQMRGS
jgi:tetratricopeptide (TPR) repeat protein